MLRCCLSGMVVFEREAFVRLVVGRQRCVSHRPWCSRAIAMLILCQGQGSPIGGQWSVKVEGASPTPKDVGSGVVIGGRRSSGVT